MMDIGDYIVIGSIAFLVVFTVLWGGCITIIKLTRGKKRR